MNFVIPKSKKRPNEEAIIQQRIARTIRLLGLLKSGPIYNSQRLADELSVSRRTVYRDLRALREAGVAVLIDKWSDAYYVRQREPGQIPLSHDQVVLLALAAHLSPLNCSRDFATKVRAAISSLVEGLPHSVQLEVGRLLSRMQGETSPLPTRVMDEIVHALRSRQPIQALTETERGVYANLEIQPSHLVASADSWQLYGQIAGDPSPRVFNVASFLRVEVIERPKTVTAIDGQFVQEPKHGNCNDFRKSLEVTQRTKAKALACAG
jgi:predicted DNA-binding transcriptional regulator YafY